MKVKFFETYTLTELPSKFESKVNDFLEKNEIIEVKHSFEKSESYGSYYLVMVLYK